MDEIKEIISELYEYFIDNGIAQDLKLLGIILLTITVIFLGLFFDYRVRKRRRIKAAYSKEHYTGRTTGKVTEIEPVRYWDRSKNEAYYTSVAVVEYLDGRIIKMPSDTTNLHKIKKGQSVDVYYDTTDKSRAMTRFQIKDGISIRPLTDTITGFLSALGVMILFIIIINIFM